MTDTLDGTGAPPRILITKIGLDGHDRGSRIVAAYLRDAGMEVIYTAPWRRVADVVQIALEEDVDAIGISSLATDHLLVPGLMTALREAGLGHVRVVVGGIIPPADAADLRRAGISHVFPPGSSREEIVSTLGALARAARAEIAA